MRKTLALVLLGLLLVDLPAWAGLDAHKTMYVGGTVNSIKEGTEGLSSAKDEKAFTFAYNGGQLSIPYERISDLEYGQKAGRRLGLADYFSLASFLKEKKALSDCGLPG